MIQIVDIKNEYWISKNDLWTSTNTIMDIHKYLLISINEFSILNIVHACLTSKIHYGYPQFIYGYP